MEKSTQSTYFCPKCSFFFSTGDQSYDKKSFVLRFLASEGVSLQIFLLGSCEIAKATDFCCEITKLLIFGHSLWNII